MIRLAAPDMGEEEIDSVARVLRSGFLVQGERVAEFEGRLARFIGAPYVAAVSNGTAALYVALGALDIGPGDTVFVPAFTFPAAYSAVELRGARPVLVDVDPTTYCVTAGALKRAIEGHTGREHPRAVIAVHEFGAPCEMAKLDAVARTHDLSMIEDAACALGTTSEGRHVGTFGALGSFSWHPRKGITTGEGGAVTTSDPALHERVLALRNHGLRAGVTGETDLVSPSLNFRLTEFQAALGTAQLARFPAWLQTRRVLAAAYLDRLKGTRGLRLPAAVEGHAWQTFMVVLGPGIDRHAVQRDLHEKGVEAGMGAHAIHLLTHARQKHGYRREDFPVAAELFERGLAIPIHQGVTKANAATVCDALEASLAAPGGRAA